MEPPLDEPASEAPAPSAEPDGESARGLPRRRRKPAPVVEAPALKETLADA